jgi:hypothetical protein
MVKIGHAIGFTDLTRPYKSSNSILFSPLLSTVTISHPLLRKMAPPCGPIMTITLTSTDPNAELISSLSGNLADYRFEASTPGEIILTAINSHKERFRKTKAELEEVVEKQRKLEEDRETLRRAHVYTKILVGEPHCLCNL